MNLDEIIIEALYEDRLRISLKPVLTDRDKARLKELNEFFYRFEKLPSRRLKPYPYNGWTIHHYLYPESFQATKGALQLRADTKEGIEKAVDEVPLGSFLVQRNPSERGTP